MENNRGVLYIVGTPIGNLEDMTFRAVKTLKEVDIIAAEDTRHTGKLLKHFLIDSQLTSYHDFNKEEKTDVLLERLKSGNNIALVTDAGTPAISDPGFYLISRALDSGFQVVPIPGPSAIIAGLSVAGLPTDSFSFHGFLPRKKGKREKLLSKLAMESGTVTLYESPERIHRTLFEIAEHIGDRYVAVAREMTKLHEEVIRGKVSDVLNKIEKRRLKGEITLLIAPERFKPENSEITGVNNNIE